MIRSRRSSDNTCFSHAIIILLLLLIGLFLAYIFLYKMEKFQGGKNKVTVNYYFLPQCGYCKQFNPEWEKFTSMASSLATINKIDGSKGDVPSYVKGFPHVEFVKDGKPEEYTGDRTANALMDKLKSLD